jgi:hypothetical protein
MVLLTYSLHEENKEQTVKWQVAAMSFRFFLTFGAIGTPVLAYIAQDWRYLAVAPLYLLSGLIYRVFLMNETKKSLRNAEYANGASQGAISGYTANFTYGRGCGIMSEKNRRHYDDKDCKRLMCRVAIENANDIKSYEKGDLMDHMKEVCQAALYIYYNKDRY